MARPWRGHGGHVRLSRRSVMLSTMVLKFKTEVPFALITVVIKPGSEAPFALITMVIKSGRFRAYSCPGFPDPRLYSVYF
jgi:hypothetical protein